MTAHPENPLSVDSARTVRPARPDDAAGIGLVLVRSWQAAYRGCFPREFLDGLDPAQWGQVWRRDLERGPFDGQAAFVAEVDGRVVGLANVGPSRDDDAAGAGEVLAIYLLPEQWGRGLGRDLMAAGLKALADFGFGQATLWVLDGNERARRFYEAGGWAPDGATNCHESLGFPITEVRYRRPLGSLPSVPGRPPPTFGPGCLRDGWAGRRPAPDPRCEAAGAAGMMDHSGPEPPPTVAP